MLAHSWGAYPVYEALIARRRPQIRKLILISPVGLTRERFDESGSRLVARIPSEVMAKLEHSGEAQLSGREVMALLAPYYQADTKHPVQMHFRSYNAVTFDRTTETLGNYDCRAIVGHLPRSVLRIYGDRDIEVPDDTNEIAAETTLVTITSSGHFSFAERPSEFIERVSAFLTES